MPTRPHSAAATRRSLDHPDRQAVLALAAAEPTMTSRAIVRELGLTVCPATVARWREVAGLRRPKGRPRKPVKQLVRRVLAAFPHAGPNEVARRTRRSVEEILPFMPPRLPRQLRPVRRSQLAVAPPTPTAPPGVTAWRCCGQVRPVGPCPACGTAPEWAAGGAQ